MSTLLQTLRQRFGHPGFRPGQEPLARALLEGRDALGILPTGGGKSLTYLLPAALLPKPLLVVSPLVALMEDQLRRAREAGLRAVAPVGSVSRGEWRRVVESVRRAAFDLLFLAPERLAGPRGAALLEPPGLFSGLVVDEAHCLVQWGFDFRPDYLVLAGMGKRLSSPVLALTATATPALRAELARTLGLDDPVRVVQSFDRPNLQWAVTRVAGEVDRWQRLWEAVSRETGPQIVYAGTRNGVESLARALRRRGVRAGIYHAGLAAATRSGALHDFLAGRIRVMVATNAFGMGVDKPDVRAVHHWTPPGSLEAYYQEAGRGGRDGEAASAHALWAPLDFTGLRSRIDGSFPAAPTLARLELHLRRGRLPVTEAGWDRLAHRLGMGARDAGAALQRTVGRLRGGASAAAAEGPFDGWVRALQARRQALRRLDAVRRYLRLRRGEHRQRILDYFGEAPPGG